MYTNNIPGWLSEHDFHKIEELSKLVPKNGNILEVGSCFGRSTVAWADNVDPSVTIYSIDRWDPWTDLKELSKGMNDPDSFPISLDHGFKYRLETFKHFTKGYNIIPIKGVSPRDFNYNHPILPKKLDLIFVDGAHSDPNFTQDIEFWYSRLTYNGIMCGHDYKLEWPDIISSLPRFARKHGKKLDAKLNGTSIWVLK